MVKTELAIDFFWGTPDEVRSYERKGVPSLRLVNNTGSLPGTKTSLTLPVDKITGKVERACRTVALVGEDAEAEYCLMAGLLPPDLNKPREVQAQEIFPEIEDALKEAGFSFDDVVRTWFYVDEVCQWYGAFNSARSEYFEKRGVFDHFLPASTGIGVANLDGAALVAGAIAMKKKGDSSAHAEIVDSPLQAPAMAYRSSFSRAAEIMSPNKTLFVSGTASIKPNSHDVAYVGDIVAQVDCTMKAVLAILESRGYGWKDVTRGIVYLKKPEFATAWRDWLKSNNLPADFACETVCDVCRDEWLFEIEVDCR
jgi:enamine deaminase RidA (YjgF/YER057c/UK114 family)